MALRPSGAVPRSRRGRVKPTRILRVNLRANLAFNRCVAQELVTDLRAGKSRWPRDTGFSQRGFFYRKLTTGGFEVWNQASYSKYLEARGRYVQRYWTANQRGLIRRCNALVSERAKLRGERRFRARGFIRSFVTGFARFRGSEADG